MNETIIKNLTRDNTDKVNSCEVIANIGPGVWSVRDELNRVFHAESVQTWRPGQYVSVKNKRIIGKAARQKAIPVVYV
jgi:hypothetical protein